MGRKQKRAAADRLLAPAVAHHQAGRLAEAEGLYRRMLAAVPDHPDALHLLGVLAHQTGHSEAAVELIRRALAAGNQAPEVQTNLGLVLQALGRFDEAAAAFLRVTALRPGQAEAHHTLGGLRHRQGRFDEAATHYRQALALKPELVEAHLNLGILARLEGRPVEAEAWYRQALALKPDHPGVLMNLGNALHDQGRFEEAVAQYRRALALMPDYAEAHLNFGNAMKSLGDTAAALAEYQRALALRPELAEAWNNRGHILQEQGQLSEALAAFDRALAIRPDYAEAHYNRADLKRFQAGEPDLAALEALAAAPDRLPPGQAVFVHFALGKALEDAGDPARAFEQFLKGNALKRRRLTYDEAATRALFHRIAAVFDAGLFERRRGAGALSSRPIFILGMPRSGSTLVEQILASHPDVLGAGELGTLAGIVDALADYPEGVPDLDAETLGDLGRAYLARLPALPAGRTRITDKMPGNVLHIGLIRLILPQARILHTVRDPVDTCVSCFTRLFVDRQEFSFDLAELGRYYRSYRELMAHWRTVLPEDAILDVRYEAVVEDLEGEARRLLAWCDLPWDPRCLAFHQTRRPIRTASAAQVRQPLFRSSLDRGRRYQGHLEPLLRELEGASPPGPPPGLCPGPTRRLASLTS
jgi:tetratricopeptide (TPR) repeat protein